MFLSLVMVPQTRVSLNVLSTQMRLLQLKQQQTTGTLSGFDFEWSVGYEMAIGKMCPVDSRLTTNTIMWQLRGSGWLRFGRNFLPFYNSGRISRFFCANRCQRKSSWARQSANTHGDSFVGCSSFKKMMKSSRNWSNVGRILWSSKNTTLRNETFVLVEKSV